MCQVSEMIADNQILCYHLSIRMTEEACKRIMGENRLWYAGINQNNIEFYENLLPEHYRKKFRQNPSIHGMGANLEDRAAGIILYQADETLHFLRILYIAVAIDRRREGVGSKMLCHIAKEAYEKDLYTTACFLAENENDPVLSLFESTGEFSVAEAEGGVFSASKAEIANAVKTFKKARKEKEEKQVLPLSKCRKEELYRLSEMIGESGFDPADLTQRADQELSRICLNQKGEVRAVILVESLLAESGFMLSYVWSDRDPVAIMVLFSVVLSSLLGRMEEDAVVKMTTINQVDQLKMAAEKLSMKLKRESVFYEAGYNAEDPM